jgi:hypothetical protein
MHSDFWTLFYTEHLSGHPRAIAWGPYAVPPIPSDAFALDIAYHPGTGRTQAADVLLES